MSDVTALSAKSGVLEMSLLNVGRGCQKLVFLGLFYIITHSYMCSKRGKSSNSKKLSSLRNLNKHWILDYIDLVLK